MKRPSVVSRQSSRLWVVVPIRGLASGKSRLSTVLDPAARRQLNRRLLSLTLKALGQWRGGLDRCLVVSPCPEALAMAADHGAAAVLEPPEADDLNGAAALGASHASRNGAGSILILPCDLPGLTAPALAAIERAAATARHMVIAPDRHGTGTNALLVNAQGPFEFRFGERSYTRHLQLAAERGWCELCSVQRVLNLQ